MTNTDFFAAIADTKIKLRKELMESKQPIEAPKNFFKQLQKTDNKINKLILKDPDEQYKESLNEYSIGIERLKIYYKKFLTRRNEPSKQRHRKYLNDFDFRFEKYEDLQDFNRILEGKGDWDKIKINKIFLSSFFRWFIFPSKEFLEMIFKIFNIFRILF